MTTVYYDPRNLVEHEGTFNYVTKAGAGFAVMRNNEQAFISARMVQELSLEVGDVLRMWCSDNFSNPETAHFASRWRAVRIEVVNRISDIVRDHPNVKPIPVPVSRSALIDILNRGAPVTIEKFTKELGLRNFDVLPELLDMHRTGSIAVLKIYGSSNQSTPTEVYYAKDPGTFLDYLETPITNGDE